MVKNHSRILSPSSFVCLGRVAAWRHAGLAGFSPALRTFILVRRIRGLGSSACWLCFALSVARYAGSISLPAFEIFPAAHSCLLSWDFVDDFLGHFLDGIVEVADDDASGHASEE